MKSGKHRAKTEHCCPQSYLIPLCAGIIFANTLVNEGRIENCIFSDQRSSDGWVFYQRKLKPQYIVREHINRINTKYDDPAKACSVYIKNQMELVRQI